MPDEQTYKTEPIDVMGVGVWNGSKFTATRVARMLRNYLELAPRGLLPQVGIGHEGADGRVVRFGNGKDDEPSLGQAAKAWINEKTKRLQMILDGLPEKFAQAVRAKRYKRVSLEIAKRWWDPVDEVERRDVVTAVRFVGLRWPGFQGQAQDVAIAGPSTATFGGEEVEVITVTFGDDNGTGGGEQDMADQDFQKQIDELNAKLAEFEGGVTAAELKRLYALFGEDVDSYEAASEYVTKLKAQFEEAKNTIELQAAKDVEAAKTARTEQIETAVATAVKEGRVDPAHKDEERAIALGMDYETTTLTFADGDGKNVEGSALDRYLASLARRAPVVKLGDEGAAADGDDVHKGDASDEAEELSDDDREVMRGMELTEEEFREMGKPGYQPKHADPDANKDN